MHCDIKPGYGGGVRLHAEGAVHSQVLALIPALGILANWFGTFSEY